MYKSEDVETRSLSAGVLLRQLAVAAAAVGRFDVAKLRAAKALKSPRLPLATNPFTKRRTREVTKLFPWSAAAVVGPTTSRDPSLPLGQPPRDGWVE